MLHIETENRQTHRVLIDEINIFNAPNIFLFSTKRIKNKRGKKVRVKVSEQVCGSSSS
jgi:hypothetical protein